MFLNFSPVYGRSTTSEVTIPFVDPLNQTIIFPLSLIPQPLCQRRQAAIQLHFDLLLNCMNRILFWQCLLLQLFFFTALDKLLNLKFRSRGGLANFFYPLAMKFIGFPLQEVGVKMRQYSAFGVHFVLQLQAQNYFPFYLLSVERVIIQYRQMSSQNENAEIIVQAATPSQEIGAAIEAATGQQADSYVFLYVIALAVIVIAFVLFIKRKSKPTKREIALIGERGSGKTQLFIGLCSGKSFETVPSITNNTSTLELGNKTYKICDFIGDNLSKQEILSELPRFHTLVHAIDGCDSKKLSDAALFIYRVLINKQFQKDPCNFVVFLNKADEKGFHGLEKLIKRLEDEVETIKSSRRNLPEENEGEQDYLRNDRTRFDLRKQGITVVIGSGRSDRAKLTEQLQQLCA